MTADDFHAPIVIFDFLCRRFSALVCFSVPIRSLQKVRHGSNRALPLGRQSLLAIRFAAYALLEHRGGSETFESSRERAVFGGFFENQPAALRADD